MELRVLQYFLAIAREQSISAAAESLHISQPTLSRQIRDMENELGKQLFIRGNRRITLTEEGMLLRKRAEEILDLVEKAENEITLSDKTIAGDVHIGAGETDAVRYLAKAARALQKDYPLIHFHITSGDRVTLKEELDRGLLDFALVFGKIDTGKYDCLKVPYTDTFGVLMRRDDPLAKQEVIAPEEMWKKLLIISRQAIHDSELSSLFQCAPETLNVVASYNLLFNGSLLVDEGVGYGIGLDKIINTSGNSNLCFRPLTNQYSVNTHIIWKKYKLFSKPAQLFLQKLQENIL